MLDVQDQTFVYDIFYDYVRSSFPIKHHSESCQSGAVATCVDSVYSFLTHEIILVSFRRRWSLESHRDTSAHAMINGRAVRASKVISRGMIGQMRG